MFTIGNVRVESAVGSKQFACDLIKCKGACCTMPGGRGAPLEDDELQQIEQAFPHVKKYLPERHLQAINEQGLYEGLPGSYATPCIDNEACVFVYYQDGIARCSFEKAFLNGEIQWRKPVSCHLFPVRVSQLRGTTVRYEHIDPCEPALERGENENIYLLDFLKEPLIRKFGEEWYRTLQEYCNNKDGDEKNVTGV